MSIPAEQAEPPDARTGPTAEVASRWKVPLVSNPHKELDPKRRAAVIPIFFADISPLVRLDNVCG